MGSVLKSQGTSETSAYMVKMEINGEIVISDGNRHGGRSVYHFRRYLLEKFPKLPLAESALRLATYTTQRMCAEKF